MAYIELKTNCLCLSYQWIRLEAEVVWFLGYVAFHSGKQNAQEWWFSYYGPLFSAQNAGPSCMDPVFFAGSSVQWPALFAVHAATSNGYLGWNEFYRAVERLGSHQG